MQQRKKNRLRPRPKLASKGVSDASFATGQMKIYASCKNTIVFISKNCLEVRKEFNTVWIDGLLYKSFSEFGIRGRMWLAYQKVAYGCQCTGALLWLTIQKI